MIVLAIKYTPNPDLTNPYRATGTYGGSLVTAVGTSWSAALANLMTIVNAIPLGTPNQTTQVIVVPPA